MPEENPRPISEFTTIGLYSQVFPTLFPDTKGDPTIPEN